MKKIYLIQSRYKKNWENPTLKRNDWKNYLCTATKQNAYKILEKESENLTTARTEFRILEYEPTGRLI